MSMMVAKARTAALLMLVFAPNNPKKAYKTEQVTDYVNGLPRRCGCRTILSCKQVFKLFSHFKGLILLAVT